MGLLSSLFSRSPAREATADADSVDNVAQARTRARQRLMGAVVLVGVGIIVFPLLFETQPRPIAVDVPIEIPRKDTAPPLSLPGTRAPAGKPLATAPTEPERGPDTVPERVAKAAPSIITETADEVGMPASKPASRPAPSEAATKPATRPEDKPVAAAEPKPAPRPEPAAPAKPPAAPPSSEAQRAQALLEGKGGASAPAGAERFIVQIGAFADPALARQTRLKVERLGLVTYTHVAKTPDGERTRVRVGPVPSREEAEKMAAKLKAAGLTAAILTL